ncbi:MAG: amylo-alpha-1,6-glucosidase [Planctomycetota bacterium]
MQIPITDVPFAYRGSFLCFSLLPPAWGHEGLIMRTMRGAGSCCEVFRLECWADGARQDYALTVEPGLARLACPAGSVEICFQDRDLARIRGRGVELKLVGIPPFKGQYAFPVGGGIWHCNCSANKAQYRLHPIAGELAVDAPTWIRPREKGVDATPPQRPGVIASMRGEAWELAVEEFRTSPGAPDLDRGFDDCHAAAVADWDAFQQPFPALPPELEEARAQALWVNYASIVGHDGTSQFQRDTMLMSRNWMVSCWSWDHCFNAMACAHHAPDLAWDQLNVHFDLQDEHGCLPDGVQYASSGWSFCKPPIHGWTLRKLLESDPAIGTPERLADFYPKLARWTRWWTSVRDSDGDGLYEYQHGNDSGWDNSTVFDSGFPVAGPDLQAFLVTQMDMLAELAEGLHLPHEAADWRAQADALLQRLIDRLWNGERFIAPRAHGQDPHPEGDSLMVHLPIVLGERLPKDIAARLAEHLRPDGTYVTEWGPATESPQSPFYCSTGYWRGPIWGPETVIVCDGLTRAGYREQAAMIARRYCRMCATSMRFAENYDALTGEPLCDKAYTWGSSAFLVLARELLS